MRETRDDEACTRSRSLGSSTMRSIALSALEHSGREQIYNSFAIFHPCNHSLNARTCDTIGQ
jgi:hypothetical protein